MKKLCRPHAANIQHNKSFPYRITSLYQHGKSIVLLRTVTSAFRPCPLVGIFTNVAFSVLFGL